MRLNKDLRTIYLFAIIIAIIFIAVYGVTNNCTDTPSYFRAWDNISKGNVDVFRTPIYPIYLGLTKCLFGVSYFELAAVIGQYLVFLVSIKYFYALCSHFIKSSDIVFWSTLFYAINPGFFSWSSCLLTESFALSGFVFLLYSLFHLYDAYSLKWNIISSFLVLFLLFLRPAFIYIIPTLFFIWITFFIKGEKRQAIAGLTGITLSSIILFLYMCMIYQRHGIFTISSVSLFNRTYIARQYGLINPDVITDSTFKSEIEDSYRINGKQFDIEDGDSLLWAEASFYLDKYGLEKVNEVIDKSFVSDPLNHILKIANRTTFAAKDLLFPTYAECGIMRWISSAFFYVLGRFGLIYLFLLLYLTILYKKCISRNIPWKSITMFLFAFGNLFVILVGAPCTWARLFLPSYPIIIIFVGQLYTLLNVKSIKLLELL